jgi:hypothetical protein
MTARFRRLSFVAFATLLAVTSSVIGQAQSQTPTIAKSIADLYATQPNYNPLTGQGGLIAESHFVSSGTTGFNGIYINDFLGATRFYNAGYTGAGVTVANIEAGYMAGNVPGLSGVNGGLYAGGHETLTQVNTFFASTTNPQTTTQLVDRHATWVGQIIGGQGANNYQKGMAYGATMVSGAIATAWSGTAYRGSFNDTYSSFVNPYRAAILNDAPGISSVTTNPGQARILNSSWGFSDPTGSAFGDSSRAVDAMVYSRGTSGNAPAMVFSAGNSGAGDGTVSGGTIGGPAAGYNVISVGALGTDPTYNTVSSFSSRGAVPVFIPSVSNPTSLSQGTVINSARGRVDISAPGEELTLAYYGGTTGGNRAPSQSGTPNGGPAYYSTNTAGTSFSAPTVAGGLALLANAGTVALGGANNALDGRVLKAVLLNSADKTSGWSNNATGAGTTANPYKTTQGLDYNVGAGRMNLSSAFDQYLSGTTGVASPTGGAVSNSGWAYGFVNQSGPHADYTITPELVGGSTFVATMTFFVDRSIDASNNTLEQRFDNLDLEVYQLDSPGGTILTENLIASSTSTWDTTEHVYFTLPATGYYAVRVEWIDVGWSFTPGVTGANFGLAWTGITPVPEPELVLVIFAVGLGVARVIQRRRSGLENLESSAAVAV